MYMCIYTRTHSFHTVVTKHKIHQILVLKPKELVTLFVAVFFPLPLAPVSFPTWKVLQTLHTWCRDSYQGKLEDNSRFLKSQVQQGRCIVTSPRRSCIMWYEIQQIQTHLWEKRSNYDTWRDWAHHLPLSWGVLACVSCLQCCVCPVFQAAPELPGWHTTKGTSNKAFCSPDCLQARTQLLSPHKLLWSLWHKKKH